METREVYQIVHFPEEILLEILVKLPPQSFYRSICVSKKWLSLVSNPSHFSYYISQSKDPPPFALIFQYGNFKGPRFFVSSRLTFENFDPTFPCGYQIRHLKVVAANNDLVLYQPKGHETKYVVANHFTGQCVTLPIPLHVDRKSYGPMGLISRVSNGNTSYNVVRLIKPSNVDVFSYAEQGLNFEIFSSEEGQWRVIKPKNCTLDVELDTRPCVAYKGILHWICNKMTTLLAYDPANDLNKCRLINIPNEAYRLRGMNTLLGVSRGKLCYLEMNKIYINEKKLPAWKLWVLKDYETGKWSLDQEGKERKIEAFGVQCNLLSAYSPLVPVAFHPWNKELVYFWYEGYILTFNVKKGWFEDEFCTFSHEGIVLIGEIFPLLMPLCPTKLWKGKH